MMVRSNLFGLERFFASTKIRRFDKPEKDLNNIMCFCIIVLNQSSSISFLRSMPQFLSADISQQSFQLRVGHGEPLAEVAKGRTQLTIRTPKWRQGMISDPAGRFRR